MKEKKVASLKIVFEDGSDYSVACEKGLDKDEMAKYIERAFKPESAEPLIKDEKVRKAVRTWAEANGIAGYGYGNKVKFDHAEHRLTWIRTSIEFDSIRGLENLDDGREYTIAELCGEEEE